MNGGKLLRRGADRRTSSLHFVKNRLLDDSSQLEVFHHDSLENLGAHPRVPDAFRIHDNDRTSSTYAKAGRFASLHSRRTEQKTLALEQRREERIERAAPSVG